MQNFIEIGPEMRLLRLFEEIQHLYSLSIWYKEQKTQIGPIRKFFFFKINKKFWKQQIS